MKFINMILTAAAAVNVNQFVSVSFKGRKDAIDVTDLVAGD